MHNRFEKAGQATEVQNESADERSGAMIEDYLERITAPLVGWKDYHERQALRNEVRAHLEAGIAAYQELGERHDEAVHLALIQLGNPDEIGRQYLNDARGFRPIFHMISAGGLISAALGLIIGIAAMRLAAMIMGVTPTADHSEYLTGALLGSAVAWRSWNRRLGIPGAGRLGGIVGASALLSLVSFVVLSNLLFNPNGLRFLLLGDWGRLARVLFEISVVGAVAGGIIGALCQIVRRLDRAPRPWVVD